VLQGSLGSFGSVLLRGWWTDGGEKKREGENFASQAGGHPALNRALHLGTCFCARVAPSALCGASPAARRPKSH